jgi:hypothetical protein
MAGDWVKPYGKGKISDFIIIVIKEYQDRNNYCGEMTITFSNEQDGLYPVPATWVMDNTLSLKLPHLAPESGYKSRIWKKDSRDLKTRTMENSGNDDQHFYFRIRSHVDNDGTISALYGKIYRDIKFSIGNNTRNTLVYIEFTYYLNPDGTRNTEFDPQKNLFKSTRYELLPSAP